jgi:Zn-finger nucleic acid-binding protein
MEVHPYYGPGNVVMDSCTTCDLVWLDVGELKQISEAPGGDRGVRKPPIPREPSLLSPREASMSVAQTDVLDLFVDLLT